MEMGDTEFKSLWNDIQEALVRLAGRISLSAQSAWEKKIEKLLTDPLTPGEVNNAKELKEMYENEVECKEEIKKVGKSLQEGFDGVHQAMERTGDDIRPAIKRTGDDVHQAIKRTGDDVHQAIEKVIKNFAEKKIAEKKNDLETSPLLTESALVGGAQDSDFLGEERASAPWDASAVPADQLPHLSSVGKLTPPGKMFTETLSQRSPQLPAGDNVEDFKKLWEIADAVEMGTENLEMKEMKEKLDEFIIERRQEARKNTTKIPDTQQ
ncbi:uncharacterized protein LOC111339570 [Stylophora pistillata]|uniref:uncharacterized protein LOC111339570 n=1 Tax=Stylophora pistillata TaxID=50429 RepID=UPI000C05645D|nr:uncharacterized protein LOC111339570 [Stylophora pistillata]